MEEDKDQVKVTKPTTEDQERNENEVQSNEKEVINHETEPEETDKKIENTNNDPNTKTEEKNEEVIDEIIDNTEATPSKSRQPPPLAPAPPAALITTVIEPKVIKKGDKVITSYVDEKTGKIAVYEPGIKLEVSDYAGTWYPAKVVEIDSNENEILVHFENWSTRYDEWIKMDSNRLRPSQNTNVVKTTFKIGEKVEAIWGADGQRYPGEILSILPNDYYQVLFDDGIRFKKKYNQIFKLKKGTRGSGRLSTDNNAPPATPPATNPKLLARPLPKLIPAPFLLGTNDNFVQQPVTSLPPNVPLYASTSTPINSTTTSKGQRRTSTPYETAENQQQLSQTSSSATVTPQLPPKPPQFSVFSDIPTDLGKRKRTVKDYSELLKTPSLRPQGNSSNDSVANSAKNARRRRAVSERVGLVVDESSSVVENQNMEKPSSKAMLSKSYSEDPSAFQEEVPKQKIDRGKSVTKAGLNSNRIPSIEKQDKAVLPAKEQEIPLDPVQSNIPVDDGKTPDPPLTKRKRTIHDYSMMLKTRLPRMSSFSSTSESETPIIARRRRRKNIALSESDAHHHVHDESLSTAVDSVQLVQPSASSSLEKSELLTSPNVSMDIQKDSPQTILSDSNLLPSEKQKDQVTEMQSPPEEIGPSKRIIKKPPALTEFDMFAPKQKKNLQHRRSEDRPISPEKSKTEVQFQNDLKAKAERTEKSKGSILRRMKSIPVYYEDVSDEELLDIPGDYTTVKSEEGDNKKENQTISSAEDSTTPSSRLDNQPARILRRPGRPFKRNKPPPGHWSYETSHKQTQQLQNGEQEPITNGTCTSTSTIKPSGVPYVQKVKAGPKTYDTRQPLPRFMKQLKIPIVPLNQLDNKSSEVLLRGLTSKKLDRLQKKLISNGHNYKIDTEPVIKDVSVDVINCSCGSVDEHGLMIQCELCQCWQHGNCFGYSENSEMPSYYVCDSCKFPFHARESMKNEWNQEFKRKGTLPRIVLNVEPNPEYERIILESSEIQDRLYQILDIIHSNSTKIQIANKLPEHPKIYQWDKPSPTTNEELKARLYEKLYKPILKRLLYLNRHDPTYQDKLRQKVINRINGDLKKCDPKNLIGKSENAEGTAAVVGQDESQPSASSSSTSLNLNKNSDVESDKSTTNLMDGNSNEFNPPEKTGEADSASLVFKPTPEIIEVVQGLVTEVENMEATKVENSPLALAPSRPDNLNINNEKTDPNSDKSKGLPPNENEKKNHTPLAEDLNLLGNIGDLSTRVDPVTDDLIWSIFNDPDFEKSFDAPLNVDPSAGSTQTPAEKSMSEPKPIPPAPVPATAAENKPIIIPTLARITPEICRENLLNHVGDQHQVVDKCLDIVERKILAMEAGRQAGINPTPYDGLKLVNLHKSVKNLLGVIDLVNGLSESIPKNSPIPPPDNNNGLSSSSVDRSEEMENNEPFNIASDMIVED